MKTCTFTILMNPVAKERARTVTKGKRTWSFTPERTKKAEQRIRDAVSGKAWFEPYQGIKVTATFYRAKPAHSADMDTAESQQVMNDLPVLPVIDPDLDNYYKTLADAMIGGVYLDDCQITTIITRKRFGLPPRIELTMEEDNGE